MLQKQVSAKTVKPQEKSSCVVKKVILLLYSFITGASGTKMYPLKHFWFTVVSTFSDFLFFLLRTCSSMNVTFENSQWLSTFEFTPAHAENDNSGTVILTNDTHLIYHHISHGAELCIIASFSWLVFELLKNWQQRLLVSTQTWTAWRKITIVSDFSRFSSSYHQLYCFWLVVFKGKLVEKRGHD